MTAKPKSRKPRLRKANRPSDIEEQIRLRAHELYERRGWVDGFALDDWLKAEGFPLAFPGRRDSALAPQSQDNKAAQHTEVCWVASFRPSVSRLS